jgi:hypothetical protein
MQDCDYLSERFLYFTIERREWIETFDIFLQIMKRFVDGAKGEPGRILYRSYEKRKFILKIFEFNGEIPSYEGFLNTFKTLCSLSSNHLDEQWTSSLKFSNVILLFRC